MLRIFRLMPRAVLGDYNYILAPHRSLRVSPDFSTRAFRHGRYFAVDDDDCAVASIAARRRRRLTFSLLDELI